MSRFELCLTHVLVHEGGFADHPSDPGGATNMGITRRTLAEWRGVTPWTELAISEVRGLARAEAAGIYHARYWTSCGADRMPPGLDLALFDFAVNSGPSRAVKYLQAQIGVGADGVIGPITLNALEKSRRSRGVQNLIETLCANRMNFLKRLSTFEIFGRGWTARIEAVRTQAIADATSNQPSIATGNRNNPMNMLAGYKTYIVAAGMLIAGLSQLLGVELPGFADQSAMQLIMEALAVIFLRRGINSSGSA